MCWFEPDKRATVMGIKQTGVTIGGSLIGIYIPFFGIVMGWQNAMLLLVFVIFGIVFFSYFFYKEKPAFSAPLPSPRAASNKEKVSVRSILLKPTLIFLTAILTLFAVCQACLTAFLVIYVHEVFHLSMAIAGSLFTVAMVGGDDQPGPVRTDQRPSLSRGQDNAACIACIDRCFKHSLGCFFE